MKRSHPPADPGGKTAIGSGNEGYRARGRIWIDSPEGTFLGYGRVKLLEQIRETGSISAAARSMKMSYRRAWLLVDSMNRQSPSPVVTMSTGGRGGGGARLTGTGERAVAVFWQLWNESAEFLARRSKELEL